MTKLISFVLSNYAAILVSISVLSLFLVAVALILLTIILIQGR